MASSLLQESDRKGQGQYTTNRTWGFYAQDRGSHNGDFGESETTTVVDDLLTRHRDIDGDVLEEYKIQSF